MDRIFAQLLVLPTPIPQVHVVVDHVVDPRAQHAIANASSWIWPPSPGDTLAALLVLTTIFVGCAALATIVANDVALQQRLMPVCDLEDIELPVLWTQKVAGGWEVTFVFTLTNNGGGPAREVRLALEQYGEQRDDERGFLDEVYLGAISPGERRRMQKPFRLPTRDGGYPQEAAFIFVLRYKWLRDGMGEAYIEDRFDPPREPARPRTTLPPVVVRAPGWLRAVMRLMRFDF